MHTARWDHEQDLTGKRVAIIGTGASAVQVIPEIAPIVEHLTVFQRTPIWCFPKPDVPLPPAAPAGDAASRRQGGPAPAQPGLRRADVPAGRAVLHASTRWPRTCRRSARPICASRSTIRRCATSSRRATPSAASGRASTTPTCPRSTATTCELVTEPIDKITGSGVATADGETRDVDVLILATGFKVLDPDSVLTYPVTGPGGRSLSAVLGRAPAAGLRGRQHPGLPELLHRVRAVRLRGLVVLRADRGADAPHRALPEAGATPRRQPGRGDRRRPTTATSPR